MAEVKKSSHKNAARSRYLIKQAFAQLMNEKDIQKITVTDIVERANISRGTFYAHYLDVYDLSVAIQNNVIETVDAAIDDIGIESILTDPTVATNRGMKFLDENKTYFKLFVTSSFSDTLINRIINRIDDKFNDKINELYPGNEKNEIKFYLLYALGAYKNIILYWFNNNTGFSAEDCAEYLCRFYLKARPDALAETGSDD